MQKTKHLYRIFTLDGDEKKEIKVVELENDMTNEENDREIIKEVSELNKTSEKKVYWEHLHVTGTPNDDGSIDYSEQESTDGIFRKYRNYRKNRKMKDKIVDFFWKSVHRLNDWRYEVVYAFERVFKKYDRRAAWDIEHFVLDAVRYNTLRLIKDGNGVPKDYCKKARKLLRNMSDDDVKKSFEKEINSTNEELNVADALWKTDLQKLVDDIDLLRWYGSYGDIDEDEMERVMPGSHLNFMEHPIPKLNGSIEVDYTKTMELYKETNDRIFDFLKNNIGKMWE
jgi:hypothetical protein